MKEKPFYIYILASRYRGTMYVGVTSDIESRIEAHKSGLVDGFTKKYKTNILVYVEEVEDMYEAFRREKLIKRWKKAWKYNLIEEENRLWLDLSDKLF